MNCKFHHQHLVVENVSATAAYYVDMLGARKVEETDQHGVAIVVLELGGILLIISGELHQDIGDHMAFAVDDFDAAVAQLASAGANPVLGPEDTGQLKFAFFKDAAGRTLELVKFSESD